MMFIQYVLIAHSLLSDGTHLLFYQSLGDTALSYPSEGASFLSLVLQNTGDELTATEKKTLKGKLYGTETDLVQEMWMILLVFLYLMGMCFKKFLNQNHERFIMVDIIGVLFRSYLSSSATSSRHTQQQTICFMWWSSYVKDALSILTKSIFR